MLMEGVQDNQSHYLKDSRSSCNYLELSLRRQKKIMAAAIPLTPVDSISFSQKKESTSFLHGFYVSDKSKSINQQRDSIIQFGGRRRASYDMNRIHSELAQTLNASSASLRLLSGLHAHIAIFMSLARIGDKVLLVPESAGGHFSTGKILDRLGLHVIYMKADKKNMRIDIAKTLSIAKEEKPNFIFVDRSEGLIYEDFSFLKKIDFCIKIFDASQYLPQIMNRVYRNPLDWGFDLMMFTLHKSYPGPQKAGVVARENGEIWKNLQDGLSTLVSSSHAENTYQFGLSLIEQGRIKQLAKDLSITAYLLEKELSLAGLPVVRRSEDEGLPHTQHIWIKCKDQESAFNFFKDLEKSRIYVNYRKLPYGLGWGIRMGTTTLIPLGFRERNIKELSSIISEVYNHGFSLELRHKVKDFRTRLNANAFVEWP